MGSIYPVNNEGQALLEYGLRQSKINRITLLLDSALTDKRIEVGGNCMWAAEASSLDAEIQVKFNDQDVDYVTIKKGMFVGGLKFSRLYISADAQAGESITLVCTIDNSQVFRIENPTEDYTGVTVSKGTTNSIDDVTATGQTANLVLSADTDRRRAYIQNRPGNEGAIKVGGSSVSATQGLLVNPGETLTLDGDCTGPIYVYPLGVTDHTICLMAARD